MTVVEFLLARLDEDEALVEAPPPHAEGWERAETARELADIAAKRVVIEDYTSLLHDAFVEAGWLGFEDPLTAQDLAETKTLRALASLYADHPDFRPEWQL